MKYKELSTNTVAFISRRHRLHLQLMKAIVLAESYLYFILSLGSFCSSDVSRRESSRCRTLPFFLTFYIYRYLCNISFQAYLDHNGRKNLFIYLVVLTPTMLFSDYVCYALVYERQIHIPLSAKKCMVYLITDVVMTASKKLFSSAFSAAVTCSFTPVSRM